MQYAPRGGGGGAQEGLLWRSNGMNCSGGVA
jgi:hypothetical protein